MNSNSIRGRTSDPNYSSLSQGDRNSSDNKTRSRSGSFKRSGSQRRSVSKTRERGTPRSASPSGNSESRPSNDPFIDDMLFTGLDGNIRNIEFEDPHLGNADKELEKTFWKKFTDNIWNNDSTWVKLFLILACFSATLILVLEITIFVLLSKNVKVHHHDDDYNPIIAIYGFYRIYLSEKKTLISSYMALYIYAEVYQIIMTLIVLYTRNTFHLTSCILFLIAMCIYAGVQYNEVQITVNSFFSYIKLFTITDSLQAKSNYGVLTNIAIAICVISSVIVISLCFVGWKLRNGFQKVHGEAIGISGKKVRANSYFNMHRDALLLALFFTPGFFLQVVIIADYETVEFKYSVAALIISIFVIFAADLSASREIKTGSTLSILFYLGLVATIFVTLFNTSSADSSKYNSGSVLNVNQSILAFGIITLILLIALIVLSILVIRNYNVGLYFIYAKNYDWLYKSKHTPVEEADINDLEFSHKNALQDNTESYEMFDFKQDGSQKLMDPISLQEPQRVAVGNGLQREELDF
ncbi:hypothetical protein CANARDRAFT_10365 [[Candida] arabinofermentans NRRL YB-2248]|uniref:Uncharacterized protein n=1 Tax=[Candida] arabinofermentans NRRL YB-2248 TaxID=983967 RepID=A0A1E4ST86_9ASCO|nr:hypothetical protein CANARDRAFT_10365 [[Candida] arabinofermentans NRRL YB-2248]